MKVKGMAVFPFILLQSRSLSDDATIMNHEQIHLRQELELLIIPFYILYFLHYFINLWVYRDHNKAYKNIIFEREAYENEKDFNYLKSRKFWGWLKI